MFRTRLLCLALALLPWSATPWAASAAGSEAAPTAPCQPGTPGCAPPELPPSHPMPRIAQPPAGTPNTGETPPRNAAPGAPGAPAAPGMRSKPTTPPKAGAPATLPTSTTPGTEAGALQHQGRPGSGAAAGSGGSAETRPGG